MPKEGKAVDGAVATTDHYGESEDHKDCGVNWLFIITLKSFKKEIFRV